MKKTFIFLASLALGIGYAQISQTSNLVATYQTEDTNAVLWTQAPDGSSGIVSDGNSSQGVVYSANDFVMPMTARLTKITVPGFCNNGNLTSILEGVRIYIMEDDFWMPMGTNPPSDALYKFELDATHPALTVVDNGDTTYEFILDLDVLGENVVLENDTRYWLSTVAMVNIADITAGASRWNWYQNLGTNETESHLLDPNDLFGAGATFWTPFSSLGLTWGEVAFTIEGEEATAGVSDVDKAKLLLYPNPVKDNLKIGIDNADLESVTITNMGGQVVMTSKTNNLNLSSLPAGVYVVKATDKKGNVQTTKVVKK